MNLDVPTSALFGAILDLASGLFMLMHWWQSRKDEAALFWGLANCVVGCGIGLMALHDSLPGVFSTLVAGLALDTGACLTWSAARILNRGSIARGPLYLALGVWLAVHVLTRQFGYDFAFTNLSRAASAGLHAAAAAECWLGRGEKLRGRWGMTTLLVLMAVALVLQVIAVFPVMHSVQLPRMNMFGAIHFVGAIYPVGSAVFLVTMLKDRSENRHRAAAFIDPLTGLGNRRAFLDFLERSLQRSARDQEPLSLLLFDLDRFKKINDTFGHPIGDQTLCIFADVLSRTIRPTDKAGRIGGEEFAVALPGCGGDAALFAARRIRLAFQTDAEWVDGRMLAATVSIGVATAPENGTSAAELISRADKALYRAKELGRNRAVRATADSQGVLPPNVARIA